MYLRESFEMESISTKWILCLNVDQAFIIIDRNMVISLFDETILCLNDLI